jgi:hypothetical protein
MVDAALPLEGAQMGEFPIWCALCPHRKAGRTSFCRANAAAHSVVIQTCLGHRLAARWKWKDYRRGGQQKPMTLNADEFIRRFLIHVLPSGFQRIRYYGLLGNRYRKDKLARCRELIGMSKLEPKADEGADKNYRDTYEELTGLSLCQCPACHLGRMVVFRSLQPITSVPLIIDTS